MTAQAIDVHHENSMPVQRGDAPMISMIERIAMDPNIPLDRLEKMLDMKERMEDRAREDEERQAKKAYFAAMSKCQAELPVVTKTRRNSHTNSTYADLAAIEDQAMPIIHKHGFAVSFQPDGYNERVSFASFGKSPMLTDIPATALAKFRWMALDRRARSIRPARRHLAARQLMGGAICSACCSILALAMTATAIRYRNS